MKLEKYSWISNNKHRRWHRSTKEYREDIEGVYCDIDRPCHSVKAFKRHVKKYGEAGTEYTLVSRWRHMPNVVMISHNPQRPKGMPLKAPLVRQPVPEVGKTYTCYDDGKLTEGRAYRTVIEELIEPADASEELLTYWQEAVGYSHWLYSSLTDYFVKHTEGYFVRTKNGGWFELQGDWGTCGELDITGELTEIMLARKADYEEA